MAQTDVSKLMATMLTELQSEAWARGVKLVADASSEIEADLAADVVLGCLTELTQILIAEAGPGKVLSLVTELEPAPDGKGMGRLKISISAPSMTSERLAQAVRESSTTLGRAEGSVEADVTDKAWSFTVTFPRAKAKIGLVSALTAVIVDDDLDTQDFLAEILRSRGFRVITVNDGFDALVAIERHHPNVVLTDILMPNMSGIDLVARIKNVRADLPVIVFSGYRDALVRNLSGLPDKILSKPMSRLTVLAALDEVLRK